MKIRWVFTCQLLRLASAQAQEARSGFELRAVVSVEGVGSSGLTEDPREGSVADAGFRSVLYPFWKIDEHWAVSGAWQAVSHPYFSESFSTSGRGVKGTLLQGTVNYSRTARDRSLLLRVGELPTAFGSFLLRYDDEKNALVDLPLQYGYYYGSVSILPVAGVQLDVGGQKWDARAQFANSSPANPRSVFAKDQYANWAGGGGYTIRQGFRVGLSGYHGPYLDRQFRTYTRADGRPQDLPASALGVDVQWARGHWNVQGEFQRFAMPHKAVPTAHEQAGYIEFRRVVHPRVYVAGRLGALRADVTGNRQTGEAALGFRPNTFQVLKFSYEFERSTTGEYRNENTVAVQLVTSFRPFSFAWK